MSAVPNETAPALGALEHVRAIAPYQAGKPIEELAREVGLDPARIVKLASNENPLGVPDSAKKAMAAALEDLGRYPDSNGFELKAALAARYGVPMDWITLGNGSNDILELAAAATLCQGRSCIYAQHSFAVYALATQARGARAIVVPARRLGHDLDAMLAAIVADTALIYVANPNNPTGTHLNAEAVEAFLARVPTRVVVVLDEAYNEYLPPELRVDSTAWVRRHPNLVVSRTFSKAFGLAGLRVGYGIAQRELTDLMNRVRQPFNVNTVAQAAAVAALADEDFLARSYELNLRGMQQLTDAFQALGLELRAECRQLCPAQGRPGRARLSGVAQARGYRAPRGQLRAAGVAAHHRGPARRKRDVPARFARSTGRRRHMKLALIGVGLVGGSLAAALKAAGEVDQVIGFDIDSHAVTKGVACGIVDRAAASAAEAVSSADLVVLAVPVGAMRESFAAIAASLPPQALVMDVGSTKVSVIEDARATLGAACRRFVPTHPIAGGERPGIEFAQARLFRDRLAITTPLADTDPGALASVERLWRSTGARLERLAPDEHDRVFAAVSHLPHVLAFALVEMIARAPDADVKFAHAGAGFDDFTRIAASSPQMWRDVCLANRVALADELTRYRAGLAALQDAIDRADGAALERLFRVASDARRGRTTAAQARGDARPIGLSANRTRSVDPANSPTRSNQFPSAGWGPAGPEVSAFRSSRFVFH